MPNYAKQGGKILALQPESQIRASNTAEPSFTATNALSISTRMTQIANFSAVNTVEIGQPGVVAAVLRISSL